MAKVFQFQFSVVEKGAKIAPNVKIGPFCYIGPDVEIAAGCVLDSNVTIVGRTTVGKNNRFFPMSVIGAAFDGEEDKGRCIIGEGNSIREHVVIYSGTTRKPTRIGQDNLIMIACQVGSGATIGDHDIIANCTHISDDAVIEDYVRTSAFSFVDKKMRVGAYAFTAGYVQVTRDVPPYSMVQGSPFRVRGVNTHNLKACGFGEQDIRALKKVFRELFNGKGFADAEVLAALSKNRKTPQVVKVLLKALKNQGTKKG
ncbi:MAG: hypothetical protein KAR11_07630 [Phycisphaerae bacterium]|nr:hypothetical protein [Phycisphaerae bacterium]